MHSLELNTPINTTCSSHPTILLQTDHLWKFLGCTPHTSGTDTLSVCFFSYMHTHTLYINKYIVKPEIQFSQKRVENTVHVDGHQVVVILLVLCREWVQSPIISYRINIKKSYYLCICKYTYIGGDNAKLILKAHTRTCTNGRQETLQPDRAYVTYINKWMEAKQELWCQFTSTPNLKDSTKPQGIPELCSVLARYRFSLTVIKALRA